MGVIVKFSPRICIGLTGVPDRGWGSGGPDPLANAVPGYQDYCGQSILSNMTAEILQSLITSDRRN